MKAIDWGGERLVLLPQKAIWWESEATLLVADTHFGKSASLRDQGVPVPRGITAEDLDRLAGLIAAYRARRLVVLGDFYHAQSGRAAEIEGQLAAWRDRHRELTIDLVRGNHDLHAGDPPACWRVRCVAEPHVERGLAFRHHPAREAGRHVLAGHLHPGHLGRVPCFWASGEVLVLPAFGTFTGCARVRAHAGDRIYAVGDDEVLEVPARPRAGRSRPRKSRVPAEDVGRLAALSRARAPRPRD